jgi:hypothetical protein
LCQVLKCEGVKVRRCGGVEVRRCGGYWGLRGAAGAHKAPGWFMPSGGAKAQLAAKNAKGPGRYNRPRALASSIPHSAKQLLYAASLETSAWSLSRKAEPRPSARYSCTSGTSRTPDLADAPERWLSRRHTCKAYPIPSFNPPAAEPTRAVYSLQ